MPDIFDLIARWWKRMIVVMVLSLLAVGLVTFLKPRQYLSVTTALPASSYASDKGKIFNENILGLYSTLGSADDLDRIVGTATLDTVYLFVADQFNLFDHYKIKGTNARTKAALLLKKYTRVIKSGYGELKVKVWDTDKDLAPQLANAIMEKLHSIHQDVQAFSNQRTLEGLQSGQEKIKIRLDSVSIFLNRALTEGEVKEKLIERKRILEGQWAQYEKLVSEYQLMIDSKPAVLVVVEKAKPSIRPDRPRRLQIMIATAVFSFLFALLTALVMERKKNSDGGSIHS